MVSGATGLGAVVTMTFKSAKQLYDEDKLGELAASSEGLRFLLLKTLDRPEYKIVVAKHAGLDPSKLGGRTRLQTLFSSQIDISSIKACIHEIYQAERLERRAHQESLIAELYKMNTFDWGGLHQNSLETTIVDNYVKKINSFDFLNECIEKQLFNSLRGYVQCSWYNHWTSILIEDIFKDQERVTPAVGLIKKVDFFIDDQPYDLKITYLPEQFVKEQRRKSKLRPELTLLRSAARNHGIPIDDTMTDTRLLEHLWAMLIDNPDTGIQAVLADLSGFREMLIRNIRANPEDLIRWLYEHQGIRRFDAANRLFLVLVDKRNYFDSWKLKRAHRLLQPRIKAFVDSRTRGEAGHRITFNWAGQLFEVTSDLLLIDRDA